MEKLTIEELMKTRSLTETEIASIVGLHVSMISKIKNTDIRLTERTRKKFIDAFNIEIITPRHKLIINYDRVVTLYNDLLISYFSLLNEKNDLQRKLFEIEGIINDE